LCQSAGARYALVTDISSYFPTVYTHTIPWALHTKPVAKANKTKRHRNFLAIFSMAVAWGHRWSNHWLANWPHTSHIIAEIITVLALMSN
jgi:hypothetical protein